MSASLVAGGGDLTIPVLVVVIVKEVEFDDDGTVLEDERFDVGGGGDFGLIIVIFVFLLFDDGVRG